MLYKASLAGEMRGSLGGVTASRNRSGTYLRQRAKPVNPNTPLQNAARVRMQNLSIDWTQTLTQAERDAWDEYAANVLGLNKLGDSINYTGINWYVSSNAFALQCGISRIDAAPTTFERAQAPEGLVVTASEASQELSVTFDTLEAWVNEDDAAMGVFMGLPQNAARNFFNGPFRFAGAILGDATTPPTSPQTIAVPFPIAAGQKLFVECKVLRADGRTSERSRAVFLAGA